MLTNEHSSCDDTFHTPSTLLTLSGTISYVKPNLLYFLLSTLFIQQCTTKSTNFSHTKPWSIFKVGVRYTTVEESKFTK